MKRNMFSILVFSLYFVCLAHGQASDDATPAVKGEGTKDFIPLWTSHRSLGNSLLFQSAGSIGIGTTGPQATLDVESTGIFGIWGATASTAQYATGVIGRTASPTGNGVVGESTALTGTTNGVFGRSASTNGIGVAGDAIATTGDAYGVYGQTNTTGFGAGVIGVANAPSGTAFGVFARTNSATSDAVFGYASASSGTSRGIKGYVESPNAVAGQFVTHAGAGLILQGLSGAAFNQVFYVDGSGNGYFAGNLNVTGNLSKGSGSFKIDDPLDAANKTLSHSFVESPEMMNIYNGVVELDARGQAWVELPKYFEALNRDFRYQLTSIGAPGPNLYIAKEITNNRFKIEGGKAGARVSWQVIGVRCDAYANAHRVPVEEDKAAAERGYFLHPDAYGLPPSQGIESAHESQPGADPVAAAMAASVGRRAATQ